MAASFDRITYDNILKNLESAQYWLNKTGIETNGTRFNEILDHVKIIADHHKNDSVGKLIGEYGNENVALWYAITEASVFISVYKASKIQKSHILRRQKLKSMLGGPFLPWDEDVSKNNTHERNSLFELEVAAKFSMPGIKVIDYDDVDFIFNKTKFNVQCKRLYSAKQISTNIKKAAEQFQRKAKNKHNIKGIIALSIDKIVGNEGMILEVKRYEEISPMFAKLVDEFIEKYRQSWQSLLNINIIGVVLFLHGIASIKEEPYHLLTTCREITLDILPQNAALQFSDYSLAKELGIKLQAD